MFWKVFFIIMRILTAAVIPAIRSGKDIPMGARILRVCDVYAALSIGQAISESVWKMMTVLRLMIDEIKNFDMEVFLAFQRVIHNK